MRNMNTNSTFTRDDIAGLAYNAVLALVTLYNAHAFVGNMLAIAETSVRENTDPCMEYTKEQAKEILAIVDSEVRDYLD